MHGVSPTLNVAPTSGSFTGTTGGYNVINSTETSDATVVTTSSFLSPSTEPPPPDQLTGNYTKGGKNLTFITVKIFFTTVFVFG